MNTDRDELVERPAFSFAELAREAEREVVLRGLVYPGLIERRKMSAGQAARRIAMMVEIARRLRAEAEPESLELDFPP